MAQVTKFNGWLTKRKTSVLTHRGLIHPVFERLPEYVRYHHFLQAAFSQLYHLVLGFPFHIASAIATSRDENLLNILVRNLYLEVGGDEGELHIDLFRRLLRAVDCRTEKPDRNLLWPEVIKLEHDCNTLYGNSNPGTKLGALFAFETMSSPMVAEWDTALRNNTPLNPNDYLFFTIHIDIELDHAEDIALVTQKYWRQVGFEECFDSASSKIMNGLENFWDRLMIIGEEAIRTSKPQLGIS